ncbi:MAG: putative component of multidrug efflux system family, partial [Tardiphaga sp.]|nr:putative component of multidrug efflux system family [Tardiphaga sp.]
DSKTFVWLVDPDAKTVSTRQVETAPNDSGSARIVSGIEAGVRIVTAGVNTLKEGQKIRLDQEPAL